MDSDDILIKAYDCKDDLVKLNELYFYCVKNSQKFTANELLYMCFAFNTYGAEAINKDIKKLDKKIKSMQYKNKDFNPELHETKKALTVKNPYATWIAEGEKTIEIRNQNTKYRGELVICSSQRPLIEDMQSGCTLALVELYRVKPLSELTAEEWKLTKIPAGLRMQLKQFNIGFAWYLKNPRKLVEYPVKGQLGIWNLVLDKNEFIEYGGQGVKDIDLNFEPAPKYDKKAVRLGALVLITIFALLVAAGLFIYSLF